MTVKAAPDIVFITYDDLKQGDPDDALALDILKKRGFDCRFVDWRDDKFLFADAGLLVLRSTWNYHLYHKQFIAWLKSVSEKTTLKNDIALVVWNSDKRYLRDLAAKGIAVVPTHYIEPVDRADASDAPPTLDADALRQIARSRQRQLHEDGSDMRLVVKPSVGLSTFGVKKFDLNVEAEAEAALAHIRSLNDSYCMMLQPYMTAVETSGEKALVFIDGKFSHAVRKSPFQHLAVAGEAGEASVAVSSTEIEAAEKVLRCLKTTPLYARVDIVATAQTESQTKSETEQARSDSASAPGVLLLELELIEPSLFLQLGAGAAEKFADAIERCLPAK